MLKSIRIPHAAELGIMLAALAAGTLMFLVVPAHAQFEANRDPMAFAAGAKDTCRIQVSAATAAELPKGYTIWSGDGAAFYINTYLTATTLSVPLKIPAGQPITISAPPPYLAYGKYWNRIFVNCAAVTDSMYCLPLDK